MGHDLIHVEILHEHVGGLSLDGQDSNKACHSGVYFGLKMKA
jgi:hypothetical protein